MSRVLIAIVLIALLAACTGPAVNGETVTGSGKVVSQTFDLKGFSRIDTNSAAQVTITRGDAYSVNVEVDDNLVSSLDVGVTGDTLHIRLKNGSYRNYTLRAQVTMPKLTGVKENGASRVTGELAGEDLSVDLNGATRLTLTGTAGRVTIVVNGASQALLGGLAAGDVKVDANGAGRIEINASGKVTGKANGGSTVVVSGSPKSVNVKTNGGAQVITK